MERGKKGRREGEKIEIYIEAECYSKHTDFRVPSETSQFLPLPLTFGTHLLTGPQLCPYLGPGFTHQLDVRAQHLLTKIPNTCLPSPLNYHRTAGMVSLPRLLLPSHSQFNNMPYDYLIITLL